MGIAVQENEFVNFCPSPNNRNWNPTSGRSSARVDFGFLPLSQDGEHLIDPERGKSGGYQGGSSEDVPPVKEPEWDTLGDAVEPEADQCHGGKDLDAQGWHGRLWFLPHRWVTDAPIRQAVETEVFSGASPLQRV